MKQITVIGGGTGTYTLLRGLRKFPVKNAVIVSTADDGGSSGQLRREMDVVPPGDIRQCLTALSQARPDLVRSFAFRFAKGPLKGHVVGNLLLAILEETSGSITEAIRLAGRFLEIKGEIVPVTLFSTTLSALLANGRKITGEHRIDRPKNRHFPRIEKLTLKPKGPANPQALRCIRQSHLLVFGPGDLHTSIIPSLLAKGIREAIAKSRAAKILVVNLMTKAGQTHGFAASDFVREMHKYLGRTLLDEAVINTQKPTAPLLARLKREGFEFVAPDLAKVKILGVRPRATGLLASRLFRPAPGDNLTRSVLRHDSDKLGRLIYAILK